MTKQTDVKIFIDSNIWIYFYSTTELQKRQIVEKLLENYNNVAISTQVLNELANVFSKKFKLSASTITKTFDEISSCSILHTVDTITIKKALNVMESTKYSYYDSLIIASALQQECSILFSEDMHNTHIIDEKLQIKNPFQQPA